MSDESLEEYQERVASSGGKANVAKHGKKHMSKIGKKGAKNRWKDKPVDKRKLNQEIDV